MVPSAEINWFSVREEIKIPMEINALPTRSTPITQPTYRAMFGSPLKRQGNVVYDGGEQKGAAKNGEGGEIFADNNAASVTGAVIMS